MEEWKVYKLGDVLTIKYGKDHKQLADGDIPIYGSGGIMRYGERSLYDGPSILIPRKGSLNNVMYADKPFWTVDTMFWSIINYSIANPLFVYYSICKKDFASLNVGSAVPSLTVPVIEDIDILLPSKATQDKVVSVLKSLDDKIEVNRRINDNLEQQAQALFKSWFVEFEPFKDGEFVESELGMIPKDWKVGSLFDVAEIHDKLRKPLSGKDREKMERKYPYYGATSCMDYVDNFIFDGIYTLIGEDGSVVKEDGLPYMQYVWGKFWVNNHAHILQGKNGYSTEMIHVLLSITNIQHLVTGAVQAKLSQANMHKILLAIPPSDVLNEIRPIIGSLYEMKRKNENESRRLASLRDTLLPRLMSGELKVNEIENVI